MSFSTFHNCGLKDQGIPLILSLFGFLLSCTPYFFKTFSLPILAPGQLLVLCSFTLGKGVVNNNVGENNKRKRAKNNWCTRSAIQPNWPSKRSVSKFLWISTDVCSRTSMASMQKVTLWPLCSCLWIHKQKVLFKLGRGYVTWLHLPMRAIHIIAVRNHFSAQLNSAAC